MTTTAQLAGLGRISYSLGRLIDPKGHAADDRRRARRHALHKTCPTCGALPHYDCHTLATHKPTRPHSTRI